MAGRPTKLTPDTADRCLRALKLGAYLETVAAAGGVGRDTLNDWVREGNRMIEKAERLARKSKKPPENPLDLLDKRDRTLAQFARDYADALIAAELRALTLVHKAAQGEKNVPAVWQAAAWFLERRSPEKWGRRRVEVTGADGQPVRAQIFLPDNRREVAPDDDDDGGREELP